MPPSIRKLLFWTHLALGLVLLPVVLTQAVTGIALVFDEELVAADESPSAGELRRIGVMGDAGGRLSPDRLLEGLLAATAGHGIASLHIPGPDATAWTARLDSGELAWIGTSSGETVLMPPGRMRPFMAKVKEVHRWFAAGDGLRPWVRPFTGASALAMMVLSATGVVLLWPRRMSGDQWRTRLLPRTGAGAKAFWWSLHASLGAWALIPLFVIAATGTVFAFPWANALVFKAVGEEVPAAAKGRARKDKGMATPVISGPRLTHALDAISGKCPDGWSAAEISPSTQGTWNVRVSQPGVHPAFAPTIATIDVDSGKIVRWNAYADRSTGTRLRLWIRHIHTGRALGLPGQLTALAATAACAGLAVSGAVLSIRRWRRRANPGNDA